MKNSLTKKENLLAIASGVIAHILVLLIGSIIIASLISSQKIPADYCQYLVLPILIISGSVAPVITAKLTANDANKITALIGACVCILQQLLIGVVVFDAVVGNVIVNVLCILAGIGIAYAFCIRPGSSRRKRRGTLW